MDGHVTADRVPGDEGGGLVVAEDDEERRAARRGAAKPATVRSAVVEATAVLVADAVVVAPDHLGRVAGGGVAVEDAPSPSASQGRSGGIGVQGACEEMSAISAKTGGRGGGVEELRARGRRG